MASTANLSTPKPIEDWSDPELRLLAHMLWHRLHPSPIQLATANQPPTPSSGPILHIPLEELAVVRLQAAARGFLTRLRMQALREAQVCCVGLVDSSSGSPDHGFQWGAKPLCLEINLRTPQRCRVPASATGHLRVVTGGQLQGAQRPCHCPCCPWVPFLHRTQCRPPRARLRGLRLHPGKQKWVRQPAATARSTLAGKTTRPLRESRGISYLPPRAAHGTTRSAAPRTAFAATGCSVQRERSGLWWAAMVAKGNTGGLVGFYGQLSPAHVHPRAGLFPWDPGDQRLSHKQLKLCQISSLNLFCIFLAEM
jgi:hypothetical protein